jgi:hypothetical protein
VLWYGINYFPEMIHAVRGLINQSVEVMSPVIECSRSLPPNSQNCIEFETVNFF